MPLLPRHLLVFLAAALRSPATVGAVAPSSSHLAARLAAVVPSIGDPVVLELGAGTGAVTSAIELRLCGRGRHLAVEIDAALANYLRAEHPDVEVLVGDAAEVDQLLAGHQVSAVDVVVSALPWSLIDVGAQRTIVTTTARSLRPGGCFTTFVGLHTLTMSRTRRFRALLDEVFDEVLPTRTIWRNLPPAVAYVCRRPYEIHREAPERLRMAS
jgi:phospholipid N-methyltransferase